MTLEREAAKGSWGEIFRDGHGLYSALVIGGIAMQATQMLVIAIIMPTIVADIGGAAYYTWAAMLYTIGAIIGASSTGVVWSRFGPRKGYALGAGIFAVSTAACALAPDIGALIAARAAQGWAGGLVAGSGMALITSLSDARLRTRIIAISQGTFTARHLSGPIVGGLLAAINCWRGSFWVMVPFMLLFTWIAYAKIPDRLDAEAERRGFPGLPMLRLAILTAGVLCVAETGPLTAAVAAAGTSRTRVYELRKTDTAFAAAWDEAEDIATDRLEDEARRRAVEGVAGPLVSAGKLVRGDDGQPITVRRYSDNLLLALIKARRPPRARKVGALPTPGTSIRCGCGQSHGSSHRRGCAWRGDTVRGGGVVKPRGCLRRGALRERIRTAAANNGGETKVRLVRQDHKRRLRAIELACRKPVFVTWRPQGDGALRGPNGEQMTREEAQALERAAGRIADFVSSVDLRL
jgi:hypothetical protein